MNTNPIEKKQRKHYAFLDAMDALTNSVNDLEDFVTKVENQQVLKPGNSNNGKTPMSLSHFLESGRNEIMELSARINEYVKKLDELLY